MIYMTFLRVFTYSQVMLRIPIASDFDLILRNLSANRDFLGSVFLQNGFFVDFCSRAAGFFLRILSPDVFLIFVGKRAQKGRAEIFLRSLLAIHLTEEIRCADGDPRLWCTPLIFL